MTRAMRRSGTNHMMATATYNAIEIGGEKNEATIPDAYSTSYIFPLKSRPRALAKGESLPLAATSASVKK